VDEERKLKLSEGSIIRPARATNHILRLFLLQFTTSDETVRITLFYYYNANTPLKLIKAIQHSVSIYYSCVILPIVVFSLECRR
jgi:hypothetical protein